MKIAEIRFLDQGEQVPLPKWTKFLTEHKRETYIQKKAPFFIEETAEHRLLATFCCHNGEGLSPSWREKGEALLWELKNRGAGIVIPPKAGEFPRGVLPFAGGNVVTPLFAFAAAGEALHRQGKNPAKARYIIAGNDSKTVSLVLAGMGDEVNHLAFFTEEGEHLEEICEKLYAERGLLPEVFASPNNPIFAQGDVVILCGMEQRGYEHMLKRNAVFIDAIGNRPVLRKVAQRRWDVAAVDGFFFLLEGIQTEGRKTEARLFQTKEQLREFWRKDGDFSQGEGVFSALVREGIAVCGFSFLGNRVKIVKNQEKNADFKG